MAIEEQVHDLKMTRQPAWNEALAVGSRDYIEKMQKLYHTRSQLELIQLPDVSGETAWAVREIPDPYLNKRGG